jgi:hypothetical protein
MRTVTLFCHEIKNGKLDAVKLFVNECIDNRYKEYQSLLKRYDLNDTKWWIHEIDSKHFLLFTHDMGTDGFTNLKNWNQNNDPFEHWFDAQLKELFVSNPDNKHPKFLNSITV